MVKFKAIGDRVFVRIDKKPQNSQGIILPDTAVNEQNYGTVESVGEKVTMVKAGDRVCFHIFDDLPTPDENLVVVREYSLLGICDN